MQAIKRRRQNQLNVLDVVEMCTADKLFVRVLLPDHSLLKGLCLPRLGIVWLSSLVLFNPSIAATRDRVVKLFSIVQPQYFVPCSILVKINTFFNSHSIQ